MRNDSACLRIGLHQIRKANCSDLGVAERRGGKAVVLAVTSNMATGHSGDQRSDNGHYLVRLVDIDQGQHDRIEPSAQYARKIEIATPGHNRPLVN